GTPRWPKSRHRIIAAVRLRSVGDFAECRSPPFITALTVARDILDPYTTMRADLGRGNITPFQKPDHVLARNAQKIRRLLACQFLVLGQHGDARTACNYARGIAQNVDQGL